MALGLAAATAASVLNALANQSNYTAPTAIWIELHTAAPGAAGTTSVAGNTTRKDITACFPSASTGSCINDVAVTWTSVSTSETYAFYAVFSASTAGTFYWSGTVTANAVSSGDTFTLPIGSITLTLSTAT